MRLERIEIQSLPGIHTGFVVDGFAAGVTLVTGPNASGKSSLLRALRYLLAGTRPDDPPGLALAADFVEDNGQRWQVRRTGRELTWRCDGRPADAPPLPEPEALNAYLMRIEDLVLSRSGHDRALSERLRRELHGGYDLEVLRQAPFAFGERKGTIERNALSAARQQRRHIERHYEALVREERDLPDLDARIEQSRLAPSRLRLAEQALERLELADRADAIEARLRPFPADMRRLLGDEPRRLQEIEARALDHRQRHADDVATLEQHQAELQATGLAERRPSEALLEQLDEQLLRLKQRIEARDRAVNEQQAAALRQRQAIKALGTSVNATTVPRLDPDSVADAEALARELQQTVQRRDQLNAGIHGVEAAPDPAQIRELQRGLDALEGWLAEPDGGQTPVWTAVPMATLGGCAVLAAWAIPIHFPDWPALPDWLVPAGGLLSLLGSAWLLLARHSGQRRRYRAAYLEGPLPLPNAWSRSEVAALLRHLDDQLHQLQALRRRAEHAEQLGMQLEVVQRELDALEAHRRELSTRIGFDSRLAAAGFDRFVRLAEQYQRAELDVGEAERTIDQLGREIDQLRHEITSTLKAWSDFEPDSGSVKALATALAELCQRCRTAAHTTERINELRERIRRGNAELKLLNDQRQALLAEAGIEADDAIELARRVDRLSDWRELQADKQQLQIDSERLDRVLACNSEFEQAVARRDREGLLQLQALTRGQAEQHQELLERRAELRARLDAAGADHRLAQALAEEADVRDRLADLQQQALSAECSGLLLDEIETEFRQRHEPPLLHAARERFAAFTHHAWDLAVGDDNRFHAIETASGDPHELDELSTATRMQLLLALRTSWAEHQEQGRMSLPFMLDEALTTSDPERFASVAASLQQLASERGRQVIYLAAGGHEPWLWQQATGRTPRLIDLAAVRRGLERAEFSPAPASATPTLPAPEGMRANDYARKIEVGRLDPRLDASQQHPFWVLDDRLELLHRLLTAWRIKRIGALRRLLEGPSAAVALPDAAERDRVLARIELLQCWIEAWRIGRGVPVDRQTLERADGVTDTMLDGVSAAAIECHGDASQLLEALDQGIVPGFRKAKLEQLEQWLEKQGHLDRRRPLDPEARRERVLEHCTEALEIAAAQAAIDLLEHAAGE